MWFNGFFGCINPFEFCKGMTKSKQAKFRNSQELQNQLMRWVNIALNLYEYDGVPDSVDIRMLEMSFLLRGAGMIAEIQGNLFSLICAPGGNYNLYGNPLTAYGYGLNGFNEEFKLWVPGSDVPLTRKGVQKQESKSFNAVMGFDNKARFPYINYIATEAMRLADIKRAEDVIRSNLKRPAIIAVEESQVSSVQTAIRSKDSNEEAIVIGLSGFSPDSAKVWDLKTDPTLLSAFADAYEREENILRDIFGLNSLPNQDKKERLITNEADANNQATQSSADIRLNAREEFLEHVNEAFGINMSVRLRVEPLEEGGEDDVDDVPGMAGEESNGDENDRA